MWTEAVKFFGSVALFLFGVKLLGEGLESVARGKLRDTISNLTQHPIRAFIVGFFVTVLLQFSSSTVVLTVGMVNSGIISLVQAGGIILGANLATPLKSQIYNLDTGLLMPITIFIGTYLYIFSKDRKKRDLSLFFLGFGIMTTGLDYMKRSATVLANAGNVDLLLTSAGHSWIIGILMGIIVTVLIQSSSATMAILITLAGTGAMTLTAALPIILGANIGTTSTALISSLGGKREGKRAALLHTIFNVLMVILILPFGSYLMALAARFSNGSIEMQIANVHLFFNLILVIIMLPLNRYIVKLTEYLLPGRSKTVELTSSPLLDSRIITSPTVAEEQMIQQTLRMADYARDNVRLAVDAFINMDDSAHEKVTKNEEYINYLEIQITSFLVKLSANEMSVADQNKIMATHHMIADIEKVGDLAANIMDLAQERVDQAEDVSFEGQDEIRSMYNYVIEAVNVAIDSYRNSDKNLASSIYDLEKHISSMESEYRDNHIMRLNRGKCTAGAGILFLDVLSSLQRIGDHCVNIAENVLKHARA